MCGLPNVHSNPGADPPGGSTARTVLSRWLGELFDYAAREKGRTCLTILSLSFSLAVSISYLD
jgi:hypothetical protein